MNYISTRGGMKAQLFSDILLEGLAPDGGLAMPESYPQVSAETLESWRALIDFDKADVRREIAEAHRIEAGCKARDRHQPHHP